MEMMIDDLGFSHSNDLFSIANGINQNGWIVGDSGPAPYKFGPFLWRDGIMVNLPTRGEGMKNSAQGINDLRQVVGWVVAGGRSHACIWQDEKLFDLGPLGGTASRAFAINNRGQVVGRMAIGPADAEEHRAFLWEPGKMTDLSTLGLQSSLALAISKREQVVGWSEAAGGFRQGFLWEGGGMVDLGTLVGHISAASDINDQGQVMVGQVAGRIAIGPSASGGLGAFFWEPPKLTTLPTLGGKRAAASAINNNGQVVGQSETADGFLHAFLWEGGSMVDLETLGGHMSAAWDINDQGQVVGDSEGSKKGSWLTGKPLTRAFLWQNGQMNELGALPSALMSSAATGINNLGQIVGVSPMDEDSDMHAFLWEDGKMTDLGTLGGRLAQTNGINDLRQIVGASSPALGGRRAVRWTKKLEFESVSINWGAMKMKVREPR